MTRYREGLALGAAAGLLAGLGEGVLLAAARPFPTILAPYKVSLDILWVAPLVDVVLFALGAVALLWLLRRLPERWRPSESTALLFVVALTTAVIWTTALQVLHVVAALLLSLGLAAQAARVLRPRLARDATWLRRRWPLALAGCAVALPLLALGVHGYQRWTVPRPLGAVGPAAQPDVLVVVIDTERADRFERPPSRSLTPNLDRLMARGVRFDNAWSTTSWSLPSQASILTGLLPTEHGADWPELKLLPQRPTLAEFFAERGYATGAFSSNSAWIVPEHLGRGFQRFEVYQLEDLLRRTVLGRTIDRVLWEFGLHYAGRGKPARRLNAQFLTWLDGQGHRPFFAYLCYMDVNRAFYAKKFNAGIVRRETTPEVIAAYDEGLRTLDGRIGQLLDELARRDRLGNTLIVVTSDHGQSFGERLGDHDPTGHGTSLYREQLRVPLAVMPPDGMVLNLPAGARVEGNVSLEQIACTITALLGIDGPFPGAPLVSPPTGGGAATRPGHDSGVVPGVVATLNYAGRESESLVLDRWHYVRARAPLKGLLKQALFDVTRDRLEERNLAGDPVHRPVIERLRQMLDQRLQAPRRP